MNRFTTTILVLAALSFSVALITACGNNAGGGGGNKPSTTSGGGGGTSGGSDQAAVEAKKIFESRCATCHGADGRGDGAQSKTLTPPPRNYHDKAWQASVTDDYLEEIIKYGGGKVGKSVSMPGNPDLISKSSIVAALRNMIREFGKVD